MGKTVKTILTIFLVVVLAVGGFLGYTYVKGILEDNALLGLQYEKIKELAEENEAERDEAYEIVDSLELVIEETNRELAVREHEIYELEDSLDNIPIVVEEMTPSARYDSLQALIPDSTKGKKYKFTEGQVERLYTTVLENRVLVDINDKLINTNVILKQQVDNHELIEAELRAVIATYQEELAELRDYADKSSIKNIKVRTQRNIFAGTSAGLLVVFLGMIIAL